MLDYERFTIVYPDACSRSAGCAPKGKPTQLCVDLCSVSALVSVMMSLLLSILSSSHSSNMNANNGLFFERRTKRHRLPLYKYLAGPDIPSEPTEAGRQAGHKVYVNDDVFHRITDYLDYASRNQLLLLEKSSLERGLGREWGGKFVPYDWLCGLESKLVCPYRAQLLRTKTLILLQYRAAMYKATTKLSQGGGTGTRVHLEQCSRRCRRSGCIDVASLINKMPNLRTITGDHFEPPGAREGDHGVDWTFHVARVSNHPKPPHASSNRSRLELELGDDVDMSTLAAYQSPPIVGNSYKWADTECQVTQTLSIALSNQKSEREEQQYLSLLSDAIDRLAADTRIIDITFEQGHFSVEQLVRLAKRFTDARSQASINRPLQQLRVKPRYQHVSDLKALIRAFGEPSTCKCLSFIEEVSEWPAVGLVDIIRDVTFPKSSTVRIYGPSARQGGVRTVSNHIIEIMTFRAEGCPLDLLTLCADNIGPQLEAFELPVDNHFESALRGLDISSKALHLNDISELVDLVRNRLPRLRILTFVVFEPSSE